MGRQQTLIKKKLIYIIKLQTILSSLQFVILFTRIQKDTAVPFVRDRYTIIENLTMDNQRWFSHCGQVIPKSLARGGKIAPVLQLRSNELVAI